MTSQLVHHISIRIWFQGKRFNFSGHSLSLDVTKFVFGRSLVSILKQITEHRLPREFDYHRMPAPWIQLRLLRLMALLGHGDQTSSEGMYEVLLDAMRRADSGINVGYAVMYECVRTVTQIYPNATLLDAAAVAISRLLKSDNNNLKYLGITGLAEIVKDHPKCVDLQFID
jgi:AP-4 complex subunit epsilon-1